MTAYSGTPFWGLTYRLEVPLYRTLIVQSSPSSGGLALAPLSSSVPISILPNAAFRQVRCHSSSARWERTPSRRLRTISAARQTREDSPRMRLCKMAIMGIAQGIPLCTLRLLLTPSTFENAPDVESPNTMRHGKAAPVTFSSV